MAVLPADSYIAERSAIDACSRRPRSCRAPGTLVVLGIPPTRPDTGFGYIERGAISARPRGVTTFAVRRFTEKPQLPCAKKYVASSRYLWNAGMFFWRVSTFLESLNQFLPATHAALLRLVEYIGTRQYPARLRHIYPRLENISVDYAVLEPASQGERRGARLGASRTGRLERHRLLGRRV